MKCETGEIVGLLGRNGTGKSSLMKIVFGALDAGHKHVRINGEAIHSYSKLIAYLPQKT
jgi:lipopolysaccharide export system ATP-binding protein